MKKFYLILILCVFASCSDSNITIYGCIDPFATNYSPNNDIDDGSCIYEAANVPQYAEIEPPPGAGLSDEVSFAKSVKLNELNLSLG
mgnify:CR=1 FL=1